VQTPLLGFQRTRAGLFVPSPVGLSGFTRQGMDQRKKPLGLLAFGPGSVGPVFSGAEGRWAVTANGAVSGAVSNAFAYLTQPIRPLSGKWYWEVQVAGGGNFLLAGIMSNIVNPGAFMGYSTTNFGWYNSGPTSWAAAPATNGNLTGFSALAAGDTLGVLYDSDAATLSFRRNGAYSGTSDTTGIPAVPVYPGVAVQLSTVTTFTLRYGLGNTNYALPSGHKHYGA
jgi:hypothetical protein